MNIANHCPSEIRNPASVTQPTAQERAFYDYAHPSSVGPISQVRASPTS